MGTKCSIQSNLVTHCLSMIFSSLQHILLSCVACGRRMRRNTNCYVRQNKRWTDISCVLLYALLDSFSSFTHAKKRIIELKPQILDRVHRVCQRSNYCFNLDKAIIFELCLLLDGHLVKCNKMKQSSYNSELVAKNGDYQKHRQVVHFPLSGPSDLIQHLYLLQPLPKLKGNAVQ